MFALDPFFGARGGHRGDAHRARDHPAAAALSGVGRAPAAGVLGGAQVRGWRRGAGAELSVGTNFLRKFGLSIFGKMKRRLGRDMSRTSDQMELREEDIRKHYPRRRRRCFWGSITRHGSARARTRPRSSARRGSARGGGFAPRRRGLVTRSTARPEGVQLIARIEAADGDDPLVSPGAGERDERAAAGACDRAGAGRDLWRAGRAGRVEAREP